MKNPHSDIRRYVVDRCTFSSYDKWQFPYLRLESALGPNSAINPYDFWPKTSSAHLQLFPMINSGTYTTPVKNSSEEITLEHLNILGSFSDLIEKKLGNYLPPQASELGEAPLPGEVKDQRQRRRTGKQTKCLQAQIYTF